DISELNSIGKAISSGHSYNHSLTQRYCIGGNCSKSDTRPECCFPGWIFQEIENDEYCSNKPTRIVMLSQCLSMPENLQMPEQRKNQKGSDDFFNVICCFNETPIGDYNVYSC